MKSIRREASVEQSFVKRLKKSGCLVYKFVSPGNDGVPDRIVITPEGSVIFVELKTEIGRLRGEQKSQIRKLKRHGQDVRVIYGADEVDQFVQEIRKEVMPE